MRLFVFLQTLLLVSCGLGQIVRRLGPFQEVFAWKQITFNIGGTTLLQDRFAEITESDLAGGRSKRQSDFVFNDEEERPTWNQRPTNRPRPRPTRPSPTSTTTRPTDDAQSFFIQYNNLPMGVERVGNRVFITLPRRRYGIPATLNYLLLNEDSTSRSPPLRPYPSLGGSRALTSVYRTRADSCGRLWMVDTGRLEIPGNPQQVQQPAIVIYDLNADTQILRYNLKSTDLPSENTPTGLASLTVDIPEGDCSRAFAYVPDLATYGLIVFSLADNDSWRLTNNFFSFNPLVGNLNIAGQRFQWNDGIFSVALGATEGGSCPTAYFHSMVGTHEFSVSTCVLRNRTAAADSSLWMAFNIEGNRGVNSHSTMHGYHAGSNVMFFADIARSAISCWRVGAPLSSSNVGIIASDSGRLSYPSDLHVSGDEVWVMANSLPSWAYSRLDTDQYNFFVYRGNAHELIRNTVCQGGLSPLGVRSGSGTDPEAEDDV